MRDDFPYLLWHGTRPSYKHTKIWGVRFYIINGRVTGKNIDDTSHCGYFMAYTATIRVIIFWKIDQNVVIKKYHHVWFGEYNSHLSIEDNHNTGSLLLQQYPKIHVHN